MTGIIGAAVGILIVSAFLAAHAIAGAAIAIGVAQLTRYVERRQAVPAISRVVSGIDRSLTGRGVA
ncbi:MAG: hypothetical protein GY733_17510 [bacterium]|nr:hypothetical protein [bacterium]